MRSKKDWAKEDKEVFATLREYILEMASLYGLRSVEDACGIVILGIRKNGIEVKSR